MTTYFDDATGAVRQLSREMGDDDFLRAVGEIEQTVIAHVTLNTGDREFPDDARETILGLISTHGVHFILDDKSVVQPTMTARDHVLTLHASALLPQMHSAFHALASRGIQTRFGRWTDSPSENLLDRDRHDLRRRS